MSYTQLADIGDASLLVDKSSEELEAMIMAGLAEEKQQPVEYSTVEDEDIDSIDDEEEESAEEVDSSDDVEEDTEDFDDEDEKPIKRQVDPTVQALLDQNRQLLEMNNRNNQPLEPSKPKKTNEEILDEFANDPQGVIDRLVNERVGSQLGRVKEIEKQQAWNAAMGNETFRRLSPVVKELMAAHPIDLGDNLKNLEAYMMMARGMEAEEREYKKSQIEAKAKNKKAAAKKSASSVAKGSKTVPSKPPKKVENMSSDEILKQLKKLGAGG